jgi:hypothetical protein
MQTAFQVTRFPISLIWGLLLVALLPLWAVLGLLLCAAGTAFIPIQFVDSAIHNRESQFRGYVRALYDVRGWSNQYLKFWEGLERWQKTGSSR